MLNLSINEQRQILGGYWIVKKIDSRNRLVGKYYFNTKAEARDYLDTIIDDYPNSYYVEYN